MENLELSEKKLENIRLELKFQGSEAHLYRATDHSLYKIFGEVVKTRLKNKKKKIELLHEMQIPFFKNPIRTLTLDGEFIGYEIEWDPQDRAWCKYSLSNKDKMELLRELREKLKILSNKKIVYGDLKDDNILINKITGKLSFCDIDNTQIGDLRMDLVQRSLKPFCDKNSLYDENAQIYMHNLYTINELYKKFDTYQNLLLYLQETSLKDSPFNENGNKIVKQLCQRKSIRSDYLIDNLKKVG
ncbi:MAG: hypothetical protein HFJ12_03965 [Bacilli bacterium]|nr:hypothetical protein [Bacilli bacterium]